jgi:hypothetical protein
MAKRRKKKKSKKLDPLDVLNNKIPVTALELIRLIHRVNPTGKGYRTGKQQKLYQLKAQLQSLLINRFRDSLKVTREDPDNPGLISLEMKHFQEDACHALLTEFDDDARSWIQEQIDLQSLPDKTGSGSAKKKKSVSANGSKLLAEIPEEYSGTELLKMGHQALAEYDYEQCERLFCKAFEKNRDPETAAALLEFYVDHLASYDKATALISTLTKEILQDENVKTLAALAFVGAGQIEKALACLGKTRSPRSGEVYLLAGRHCLDNQDVEQAGICHAALNPDEFPELRSEIIQLTEDIERFKADQLKPVVEEMLQAWEEGKVDTALKLADELLTRNSSNREAKQIKQLVFEQQQQQKIRQLLLRADNAHKQNEFSREVKLLQQLIELQGEDNNLEKRLQQAIHNSTRQQQEKETATVVQLLAKGKTGEGLLLFTALTGQQQQQVEERQPHNCIPPLLRIINSKAVFKQRVMVEAVLALDQARQLLRQNNPADALSAIRPHMKTLTAVPEAAELCQQAEAELLAIARPQALSLLKKARQSLDHEKISRTRRLIESVDRKVLPVDAQKQLDTLLERLCRLERVQGLKTRYTHAADSEDHLEARMIARELESYGNENEWQDKIRCHGTAIQKQFALTRIKVNEFPPAYNLMLDSYNLESANSVLLDNGRHVVYAATCGRYLVLYIVDIEQQESKEVILCKTPVPLEEVDVEMSGETVWAIGGKGLIIQLSLAPLDVLACHDYRSFVQDKEIVVRVEQFPGTDYLWLTSQNQVADEITRVINTDKMIVERQLNTLAGWGKKVRNRAGFFYVDGSFISNRLKIYSERGKVKQECFLSEDIIIDGAVFDPDSDEFFFLKRTDVGFDEDYYGSENVSLARISQKGEMLESVVIDADEDGLKFLGRSDSTGLLYVVFSNSDNGNLLQAWDPAPRNLQMLYEIPVSAYAAFATDEFHKKLVMINPHQDGCEVALLGRTPPQCTVDDSLYRLPNDLTDTCVFCNCRPCSPEITAMKQKIEIRMKKIPKAERYSHINFNKYTSGDQDEILAAIFAFDELAGLIGMAMKLRDWFMKKYPDHYYSKIKHAEHALKKQNWQECIQLLTDLSRAELDDEIACHICHLLGLAHQGQGNPEQAIDFWQEGADLEQGTCQLTELIHYASMVSNFIQYKGVPGDIQLPERLRIFVQVDLALAERQWTAVIEILEQFSHNLFGEIQLLARFSEAYLHLEPGHDSSRHLGKILVFSMFLFQRADGNQYEIGSFPDPVATSYSESRLEELADQAEQWLSENDL